MTSTTRLAPDALTACFGVYPAHPVEWIAYGCVTLVLAPMFFFIAWQIGNAIALPVPIVIALALSSAGAAIAVITMQAMSKTIIGPDAIRYVSGLPMLSWSVPLQEIVACELIRARRAR